ncbi:hypothetical protein CGZ98_06055 [Enemella evansiae]|nr:hypothetical protein CGZ98_06055 [Enemella evansiae]
MRVSSGWGSRGRTARHFGCQLIVQVEGTSADNAVIWSSNSRAGPPGASASKISPRRSTT